jgi:hypothetical protein
MKTATLRGLRILDIIASIVFASISIVIFFKIGMYPVLIATITLCLSYTAMAIFRGKSLKMKPLTKKILYYTSLTLLIIMSIIVVCAIIVEIIG